MIDGEGSFSIDLGPSGDAESAFRIANDPSDPYQRGQYVERKGPIDIRCSSVDVIHGLFASDSDVFSSLLVLQFRFDSRKRARRIAQVNIELRFSGTAADTADPEVYAIAPDGRFSFAHTTQTEEVNVETQAHLGGGGAGVDAGVDAKYGKTITKEMTYATVVTGSIDLRGRNYGKPNCASWTLLENPATKTGVPAAMKTAILLKRRSEEPFQCVVSVKARADWRTALEWLVGSTKPDDPVLFNPLLEPTSDRYKEHELDLGKLDLEEISDITFATILDGVIKTKKAKPKN
ncbi:hypothetical protein F5884DRAFT_658244 [Xylogone sp. PMI_703]|nr:hypothetical protein F5884DRAFT_658244 [Xylogone sp. PMI_703]